MRLGNTESGTSRRLRPKLGLRLRPGQGKHWYENENKTKVDTQTKTCLRQSHGLRLREITGIYTETELKPTLFICVAWLVYPDRLVSFVSGQIQVHLVVLTRFFASILELV